jgi:hypothetical protein
MDPNLPRINLTTQQINKLKLYAFGLGAAAIVFNGLGAIGMFGKEVMQIFNAGAMICTGLSWYFAGRPARHLKNGDDNDEGTSSGAGRDRR